VQQLGHCKPAATNIKYIKYLIFMSHFSLKKRKKKKKKKMGGMSTGLIPGREEVVMLGALLKQLRRVVEQTSHPVIKGTARAERGIELNRELIKKYNKKYNEKYIIK
jgi:preprotein translocase subunit YajC